MTLGKIPLSDDAAAVESDQLPALGDESPPFTVAVSERGESNPGNNQGRARPGYGTGLGESVAQRHRGLRG